MPRSRVDRSNWQTALIGRCGCDSRGDGYAPYPLQWMWRTSAKMRAHAGLTIKVDDFIDAVNQLVASRRFYVITEETTNAP